MNHDLELCGLVYHVLLGLIQFGMYRYGDKLPTIENTAAQFLVSTDTVRSAYLRLKREGYISLTKNVGAVVQAQHTPQEIEGHIQAFFALRRTALIDLSHSVGPLLGRAQYIGLRYAGPDTLEAMETLSAESVAAPCVLLQHFKHKYAPLGNEMLMRLVWQTYMFYYAPFLSIPYNLNRLNGAGGYVSNLVRLCRSENWAGLQVAAVQFQDGFSHAVRRFLEESITEQPGKDAVAFHWDSYRKSSQHCYSLAMELLMEIHRGVYPAGSLLPTLEQLAAEKGVSVSTVRRAQAVLAGAGAIKGTPRVGTVVLSPEQAAACCDFTRPSIRQRLVAMAQSLQILALSCKEVSRVTVASLNDENRRRWRARLREIIGGRAYGTGVIAVMELIRLSAPYQTIRLVYTQLLRQSFWYNAFRSEGSRTEKLDTLCLACYERMIESLEENDPSAFSDALAELTMSELQASIEHLLRLGIREAGDILIPACE